MRSLKCYWKSRQASVLPMIAFASHSFLDMEVPFLSLLLVFLIFIGTLLWRFERSVKWFIFYLTTDIPGPTLWQLLNVHAKRIMGDEFLDGLFDLCASYDFRPWGVWMHGDYFVILSDCDTISELYKSKIVIDKPAMFYENMAHYMGKGVVTSNGPNIKRDRILLTPTFRKDLLESHLPRINEHLVQSMKQFDAVANGETVDVSTLVEVQSVQIGFTIFFSGIYECSKPLQVAEFIRTASKLIHQKTVNPVGFWLTSFTNKDIQHAECLTRELKEVILDGKNLAKEVLRGDGSPSHQFEVLFHNHVTGGDGSATVSELLEESINVLMAASETVASAEIACLYLLALHPEEQQRVYEELESIFGNTERDVVPEDLRRMVYLEWVIKETFRLFPSVPVAARHAPKEVLLNGVKVPKGASICPYVFALHRNPQLYEDPLKFNPERFSPENCASRQPGSFIPFSNGGRSCIGNYQAYMVMKIFFSYIIRNFKILPGESLKNVEDINIKVHTVLRFPNLPLRFVKRCCN